MFKSYSEIFDQRGNAYHQAMRLNSDARNIEFALALENAELTDGLVICDMPSGGGYLQDKLPADLNIRLISIDSSRQFSRNCMETGCAEFHLAPLDKTPLDDGSVDRVVSIAGLHHLESKLGVLLEMKRILSPGGRLCILDVPKGAITDPFLNEFVHKHNRMGHTGTFLDSRIREELAEAGFTLKVDELRSYAWNFIDTEQMVRYAQLMFGIDLATEDEILAGISRYLGYTCSPSGCHMNWELQLICAE
jgi:SAM-dependent methyltransferase